MAAEILASGILIFFAGFLAERMLPKLRLVPLPPDGGAALKKPAFWRVASKLFFGGSAIVLGYELSKRFLLDQPQIGSVAEFLQVVSVPFFLVMGVLTSWLRRGKASGVGA
jgi:hypothetical protein